MAEVERFQVFRRCGRGPGAPGAVVADEVVGRVPLASIARPLVVRCLLGLRRAIFDHLEFRFGRWLA